MITIRFNYFNQGQPITKDQFLKNVPEDWKSDLDCYGHFSHGHYRAGIVDEYCIVFDGTTHLVQDSIDVIREDNEDWEVVYTSQDVDECLELCEELNETL